MERVALIWNIYVVVTSLLSLICFEFIPFQIPQYNQREWDCLYKIDPNCQEFAVLQINNDRTLTMELGLHTVQRNGSIVMSLYCPFWMLNKTGIQLTYGVSLLVISNLGE